MFLHNTAIHSGPLDLLTVENYRFHFAFIAPLFGASPNTFQEHVYAHDGKEAPEEIAERLVATLRLSHWPSGQLLPLP